MTECDYSELSPADRRLVDVAKEMTRNSYAPYSRFHVGAAILMDNGEIVRGSNQENAAYPSGTCAERTACYQASALHPGVPIRKIAIAAATVVPALSDNTVLRAQARSGESSEENQLKSDFLEFQKSPISPCGACRQALLEYEHLHGPIEVILYGEDRTLILPSVSSLLPLAFTEF